MPAEEYDNLHGLTLVFPARPSLVLDLISAELPGVSTGEIPDDDLQTDTERTIAAKAKDAGELKAMVRFRPGIEIPVGQPEELVHIILPLQPGEGTPGRYEFTGYFRSAARPRAALDERAETTIAIVCCTDLEWVDGLPPAPTLQVATPVITPGSGTIDNETEIAITCGTGGATIYYTVDGTDPTTASPVYTGTFILPAGAGEVRAFAVLSGYLDSAIATAIYTVAATEARLWYSMDDMGQDGSSRYVPFDEQGNGADFTFVGEEGGSTTTSSTQPWGWQGNPFPSSFNLYSINGLSYGVKQLHAVIPSYLRAPKDATVTLWVYIDPDGDSSAESYLQDTALAVLGLGGETAVPRFLPARWTTSAPGTGATMPSVELTAPAVLSKGTWHHLAFRLRLRATGTQELCSLWVDGALVDSATAADFGAIDAAWRAAICPADMWLDRGRYGVTGANRIQDLKYWTRALTDDEIAASDTRLRLRFDAAVTSQYVPLLFEDF